MTLSTQAAKRRGSALETLNNPLEQFSNGPSSSSSSSSALENHELKIENLVDTVKIESDELMDIINSLQRVRFVFLPLFSYWDLLVTIRLESVSFIQ